jgi:hypothetical protein
MKKYLLLSGLIMSGIPVVLSLFSLYSIVENDNQIEIWRLIFFSIGFSIFSMIFFVCLIVNILFLKGYIK